MNKIIFVLTCLCFPYLLKAQVNTTMNDFFLPGSQPGQSGSFNSMPGNCGCHGGYDEFTEPMFNWEGSMMAQSQRDPLFLAALTIANQDAAFSGDLCIRCHSPRGWLSGRSEPTDGSALDANDYEGVYCDICHRTVKPTEVGLNPYPSNTEYTNNTYPADQTYLQSLNLSDNLPSVSANGMYLIDSDETRRGPYTQADAAANHAERYSPFHSEAYFCGTCHDVSNPVFTKQPDGTYALNALDQKAPDDDPYTMFPVERTFSEWKLSSYNSAQGVYAPQFGGNLDYVSTCQDCHMRDVTGYGCNKTSQAPLRNDLGKHDLTGGNTFIPKTLESLYPGEVNPAALSEGVSRADTMLKLAATLEILEEPVRQEDDSLLLRVKITNETGHKLPSGYPEGRRMWLNVKAFDIDNILLFESCRYDSSTGEIIKDGQAKIYETKPGISRRLAQTLGRESEPSFNFVLNDTIFKDNRIPPRGFTNQNFEAIQAAPVDYSYADGQHWDITEYKLPPFTAAYEVALLYQTAAGEYIEFLRDSNTTDERGNTMYDLWNSFGKSAPVVMNSFQGNISDPLPVELTLFNAELKEEGVYLTWKTETEENNYGFELQRKQEAGNWKKLAFIHGSGNSNTPRKYSFIDQHIENNVKFLYRLKQIDTDGSYKYSQELEVDLRINEFNLAQNYPNPFNSSTKISYTVKKGGLVVLTVYDILGREVAELVNEFKAPGRYNLTYNATDLESGVYLLSLNSGNNSKTLKMLLLK